MINLQKKMGLNTDSKLLLWKKRVEENLTVQALIKDVQRIQGPEEDDMILDDYTFDFTEETVNEYRSYSKLTHKYCVELIEDTMQRINESMINDVVLGEVMHCLRNQKLPLYK